MRPAHLSAEAKLVKLAVKSATWATFSRARRRVGTFGGDGEYFDWAKAVVHQIRGADQALEGRFDKLYRQRP